MTLTFQNTVIQSVTNTLQLNGLDADDLLILRSDSSGTQWRIDPTGSRSLVYLDVKDSNNIAAAAANCFTGCLDTANNINWSFSSTIKKILLIW